MKKSREERRALLRLARNFRAALESAERERDERDRYTGTDPRNTTGAQVRAKEITWR